MSFRNRAFCLILAVMASCGEIEDSALCPCRLCLAFGEVVPGNGSVAWMMGARNSSFVDRGCLSYSAWPRGLVFSVPRDTVIVKMLVAGGPASLDAGGLVIKEGEDCPYVYQFSNVLDCCADETKDTIVLLKKFALLRCEINNVDDLHGELQYEVEGDVCGYDIFAEPSQGPFRCVIGMEDISLARKTGLISLPKQVDESLRLNVKTSRGQLVRTFAIGEYIEKSGYDWNADNLEDIEIEIDLVNSTIFIYQDDAIVRYFDISCELVE